MSPRYPESRDLVRAIAKALGADGPTQAFAALVERGALEVREQRKFLKWWGGHNRPSLEAAVAVLRAAGMLDGPVSTVEAQTAAKKT